MKSVLLSTSACLNFMIRREKEKYIMSNLIKVSTLDLAGKYNIKHDQLVNEIWTIINDLPQYSYITDDMFYLDNYIDNSDNVHDEFLINDKGCMFLDYLYDWRINCKKIELEYNNKTFVNDYDIYDYLNSKQDFSEFFVEVHNLMLVPKCKNLSHVEFLYILRNVVNKFNFRFNIDAIVSLSDFLSTEIVLEQVTLKERKTNEKEYKKYIINHFKELFPRYKYIGTEIKVENIGKIDILAKCNQTKQDVIIELKVNGHNPNKQLIAYGSVYKNPILIGITDNSFSKENRLDNIIYFTYDELNIKCVANV